METLKNCTVYIDEAGDLGANRGTRWFVLSAVIVNKEDENNIRANIAQIKKTLNINEIHLRNIREFKKKAYIVRELNKENFTYMNIVIDTNKLKSELLNPLTTYNYACRYLIERVSWFLRDKGIIGDIVLSSRGTSRDGELIEYLKKLIRYEFNSVTSAVLNKVTAKPAASWDLLQLADVCATSMFLGYETDKYGFNFPCFSRALSSHLYRHKGKLINYGIKFFTNEMEPDSNELKEHNICIKT